MERIFLLKLENGAAVEARADINLELSPHDACVFTKDFYTDLGIVCRELDPTKIKTAVPSLPQIQRLAAPEDLAQAEENQSKNRTAMSTTQTLVDQLGLEMKLINAHSSLDGKLMTIQFSAEGRVDFRELIKELTRTRCSRIELRQIGVRDETGIYGGIGACGQVLCCSRFLKEFNSINVKMAKEQDLSLTPATISGACGRLKCCLKYEHDGYTELAKGMPKKGEFCETPDGPGRITDRNLLTGKVFVTMENGNINQYDASDVKIAHNADRKNNPGPRKNQERPKGGKGEAEDHPHHQKNNRGEKNENRGEKNENRGEKKHPHNANNSRHNEAAGNDHTGDADDSK